MKVLFAIDLLDGMCVRLERGSFETSKVYSLDPLSTLHNMMDKGAKDFHIIDLNGARDGVPRHIELVRSMRGRIEGYMQVGGGVRTLEVIERFRELGADGIILGTEALDGELIWQLHDFRGLILALDVLDGVPMVRGWRQKARRSVEQILEIAEEKGFMAILVTAIERDGMLSGPDLSFLETLLGKTKLPLIASGGVADSEDLRRLKDMGLFGAVVGKAIYEGKIKVEEAVKYAD
ncbi:MAG: 1-(5-phosphoribosyl)-5-[(5-phosphoribosylamino)methylideneamino] imidazole-4-carboxamide isomerase [Candidatus Bathyarchaeia archaeon]